MKLFSIVLSILITSSASAGELPAYTGDPLPDFALPGIDKRLHRLSDLRGRVVLVNFWATWCGPCLKEMPSMQRLSERFPSQDFAVLAVNMGESVEDIRPFVEKMSIQFPIPLDSNGEVLQSWQVIAFPTTFLLDRSGTIRFALFGGLEWDQGEALERIKALIDEQQQ